MTRRPPLSSWFVVLALLPAALAQYSFTDLRTLGFGGYDLVGLSPDGATILGSTAPSPFGVPVYIQNGERHLLPIGEHGNGIARSMSLDGTIVGELAFEENESTHDAAVWRDGTLSLLEYAAPGGLARAKAISSDGRVVVGSASLSNFLTQTARWVDGQVESLGDLPGSDSLSQALAVSADGSVIVGHADGNNRAFRWMNGVMEALPLIGETEIHDSSAYDVSADGRRIIGWQEHFNFHADGMLWEDGEAQNLGYLAGGDRTYAEVISDDGRLIFGQSGVGFGAGMNLFIWDEQNGMRTLMEVLENAGVDLNGWSQLRRVEDISADGRTILGYGYNALGEYTPFIATIPEPGSLALVGTGLALLAARRRRGVRGSVLLPRAQPFRATRPDHPERG